MSVTLPAGATDAGNRLADGATLLVGDPDDPVVFLATAAAQIDSARLERLQELAGGMTVLGLGETRTAALGLAPLDAERPGLALTAPVDAVRGIRGGWSARDRAHTIRVAADPTSRAADLAVPGHVHTAPIGERSTPAALAALELVRGGGGPAAVVLGEVTARDGTPATLAEARALPEVARLPHVTSTQARAEALSRRAQGRVVECALPTGAGRFRAVALDDPAVRTDAHRGSVVALLHGDPTADPGAAPLIHVHRACLLGDAFGSLLCDCGAELAAATEAILAAGAGVIVYVKPGTADPERRYHCGRDADVDLAGVLALLHGCGIEPTVAVDAPAAPAGRWFTHRA